MERSADQIDRANDIAQSHTDDAVEAARRGAAPEQDPDNIDPCCCDCGDEIEAGRLQMLKKRCFTCQTVLEKKGKLYSGGNRHGGGTFGGRY